MRFFDRHGNEIFTLQDWARLGKPAAEQHWVEGRSAYELAAHWIDRDAAARVGEVLLLRPELSGLTFTKAIAEKQTAFDDIRGGRRNHDLLVHATCDAGPVVIGVEGKADEPFDHPLTRWRERAVASNPRTRAPERLDKLTTLFFSTTVDTDEQVPSIGEISYQLLSALAGTLAEAKKADAAGAVLLIQEFRTAKTYERKHSSNAFALELFLQRLAPGSVERTDAPSGWITSPIEIRGDGQWFPTTVPVFVAKLVVDRRDSPASQDRVS